MFLSGAHNPERATPILGLCHGAFMNQFIFRQVHFWALFPEKWNPHHAERIRSIRYQIGN